MTVIFRRERRLRLHASDGFLHHADARGQILRQMRAFAFAHFHQRGERVGQRLFHRRPQILRPGELLVRLENAGGAQHLVERNVAGNFQLLRQPRELGGVGLGQRLVDVLAHGNFSFGNVE